jgi:hypothetical protein
MAISDVERARELRELIVALDARVPRASNTRESAIACDAAALRARALKQLGELAQESSRPATQLRTR